MTSKKRHSVAELNGGDQRSADAALPQKKLKTSKGTPTRDRLESLIAGGDVKPLRAELTNGVSATKGTAVDYSSATVAAPDAAGTQQDGAIEISSDGSSSEEESDEEDGDEDEDDENVDEAETTKQGKLPVRTQKSAISDTDVAMEDDEESSEEESDENDESEGAEGPEGALVQRQAENVEEEPSFADQLRATAPAPIDANLPFSDMIPTSLVNSSSKRLSAPTATSLGTVLTQALRTNDNDLLESCFQMTDLNSVRATIERLDSIHVASLLQRLAERLHRRPGRAGNLLVWVQWSLVAHGGYLASQPDVMIKVRELNQVLKERAQGLQPLLALKGRLDMLSAQIALRKSQMRREQEAEEEEVERRRRIIYVEGEEDDAEDEELDLLAAQALDDEEASASRRQRKVKGTKPSGVQKREADSEDEVEVFVNGTDDVEDDDEASTDDDGGLDEESDDSKDEDDDLDPDEIQEDDEDEEGSDDSDAADEVDRRSLKRSRAR